MKRVQTPSFILELPLQVAPCQAKHLHAHFEAGRCLYNALLSETVKRLRQMRADPRWQVARALLRSQKQERQRAFSGLRDDYGFTEYALHRFAWEPDSARTPQLSRLAEKLVWQECGNARARAVDSASETRGCKHRRLPGRIPYLQHQALAILPWLPDDRQKAVVAAFSCLSLWGGAGAAGPLLRLSDGLSG